MNRVLAFHSCIVQGKEYIPISQENQGKKSLESKEKETTSLSYQTILPRSSRKPTEYKRKNVQPLAQPPPINKQPFDYTMLYSSSKTPSTTNSLLDLAAGLEKLNRKFNVYSKQIVKHNTKLLLISYLNDL